MLLPHEVAALATHSLRILVVGPRASCAHLADLSAIASRLRRAAAPGVLVGSPLDVARYAGTRDWASVRYARAKAEAMTVADLLVLAPGWERDESALTTVEIADVMGLAVVEWPVGLVELVNFRTVEVASTLRAIARPA